MTLPRGVVTFVFSDIEGSTKLWESDPDGMWVSLSQHDEIIRTIIEPARGTVFKHTGDGFMGFAAALSKKASVSFSLRPATGRRTRSSVRKALGEKSYHELLERGAKSAWEDLPLIYQKR